MWKAKLRSGKKKKKQQKVSLVKEDLRVKQSGNRSDWPMFTVSDCRGKCKEFIVPVTIILMTKLWTWNLTLGLLQL